MVTEADRRGGLGTPASKLSAAGDAIRIVYVAATGQNSRSRHDGIRHRLGACDAFVRDSTSVTDQHHALLGIDRQRVDAANLVLIVNGAAAAGRQN